jgi:iron complex transport system substrate-binding protein
MAVCLKTDSFAELSDKSRGSMRYVMELIDYINEHYRESLTAETLSRQMNLSPTYLYSLFRTYLGVTPLNYINSVRLREAYGLLEEGRSVTEAASAVWIPNVSYFIKLFKSATGVTPFQWKSRKKQKTTQD